MRKRKCRLWDFICKKEYLWHPYELAFRPIWKGCYAPKYGTIKQTRLIMGRALYYIVYIIRTDSINKVILESKKFIRSAYS